MKLFVYLVLSFLVFLSIIYYAYYIKIQFYPTLLFLVSSKLSLLVGGNLAFAVTLVIGRIILSFYFGKLRDAEIEVLVEKSKFIVIETCVALTIFRGDINATTFVLFAALIFVKLMHKLSKARLEYFEQVSPISLLMKTRMSLLLLSLLVVDATAMYFAISHVMTKGKSVVILFAFEFSLLLVYCINLSIKFLLQIIDEWFANGFASKGLIVLVFDLLCELVKFLTYLAFFGFIMSNYALPIHLLRDVWAAFHSLQRKAISFLKYLQLTRNLQKRFPDATSEELQSAGSCLVCREDMNHGKKLPCGHVFHMECLRMWLQHQQSCPLCRADIPSEAAVTVPPQTPPVAPPAEAPVDVPTPTPAPTPNQPESSSPAFTRAMLNAERMGGEEREGSFPACYVVMAEEVIVRVEPKVDSRQLRSLKMGCLVLATMRVMVDSRHWLKINDGWISEENNNDTIDIIPFSMKGTEFTSNSTVKVSDKVEETKRDEVKSTVYSRNHFLNREKGSIPKQTTSQLQDIADEEAVEFQTDQDSACCSHIAMNSNRRFQELQNLQSQINEMSKSMHILSRSILQCQKSISILIKDEIQEQSEANLQAIESLTQKQ